jgi:hypothetical protein
MATKFLIGDKVYVPQSARVLRRPKPVGKGTVEGFKNAGGTLRVRFDGAPDRCHAIDAHDAVRLSRF